MLPYVAGLGSLLRIDEIFNVDRLSITGLGSRILVFEFKLVVEPVYRLGFASGDTVLAAPYLDAFIFLVVK